MADFAGTDRYEVIRRLGQGGMGAVYEALDRERQMHVALKTLLELDDSRLYLFKQEFRSLANVVHPNLVTLYELVATDASWFFTMELIDGLSFLDFVRHGQSGGEDATAIVPPSESSGESALLTLPVADRAPALAAPGPDGTGSVPALTPEQLVRLRRALRQLVTGVGALHDAGKLHCDIKPSNALVDRGDRVVLLDFGLVAHRRERTTEHRASREAWGTVAYMAPEQVRGTELTPATDWYAVGATLYQALTGRTPFTGRMSDVMQSKLHRDPLRPGAIAPGVPADLEELCLRLLHREPAERPGIGEILRDLDSDARASGEGPTVLEADPDETLLVGRAAELGVLRKAFGEVRDGRTKAIFVHGKSGVGKSTLLDGFAEELAASEDVVVLSGRCYPDESVPYKAVDSVVDNLSQYLRGLPEPEARALLPAGVHALARVFPVLSRFAALAPAAADPAQTPQQARRQALSALRELLERIGRRAPLVLLADDLQWGDEDSVALIAEILRPPGAPRLLFLGSYRDELAESSPFLASLRQALTLPGGAPGWRDLPVQPLDPEAAVALAEALLGPSGAADAEQVGRIVRESHGSPYFLRELARAAAAGTNVSAAAPAGGPLTLDDVLWSRVQKLPEAERRLLEIVAVSGRPLRIGHAYGAAFGAGEARPGTPALRVGRLVRSTGSGDSVDVDTYHDRVRETILARMPDERRREHHGRIAHTLESSGFDDPETLAVHFHGAGEARRAGGYYARAGESAAGALAFEQAARLLRLSLELAEPPPAEDHRLRLLLADALDNAGRGPESAREYERASAGAPPSEALDLRRRAAYQYCISGHVDAGRTAFGEVLAGVGMRLPASANHALLSVLWSRARLRLRGVAFRERAAGSVAPELLARIDIMRSVSLGLSIVDPITGADFQTRSLLLALDVGEPERVALSLAWEAAHSSLEGTRGARWTAHLLTTARSLAERTDSKHARGLVALATSVSDFFEGRFDDCGVHADEARDSLRGVAGVSWELRTADIYGFWGRLLAGDVAELRRRLDRLSGEAEERGDLYSLLNITTQGRTMVRLAAGDPEGARAAIRSVIGRWTQHSFTIQHLGGQFGEFSCDLYEGDAERAWRRVGEVWPRVHRAMQSQVQYIRIQLGQLSALAGLARARQVADPSPYLRDATKRARSLRGERVASALPMAAMIEAGVAALRRDRDRQRARLEESIRGFDTAGLVLFAAAARDRLGTLIGGDEGAGLRAASAAVMAAQGVTDPERMNRVFAPDLVT